PGGCAASTKGSAGAPSGTSTVGATGSTSSGPSEGSSSLNDGPPHDTARRNYSPWTRGRGGRPSVPPARVDRRKAREGIEALEHPFRHGGEAGAVADVIKAGHDEMTGAVD